MPVAWPQVVCKGKTPQAEKVLSYLGGELKVYACPIGSTFFDELCLIMMGFDSL